MPTYAENGDAECLLRSAQQLKARYATLGLSDWANLDKGTVWPTAFAVREAANGAEKVGARTK